MLTNSLKQLKSVGFKETESNSQPLSDLSPDIPLRVGGDGTTWGDAKSRLISDLQGPDDPTTLNEVARATASNPYRQFSSAWSRHKWRQLLGHHRHVRDWQESTVLMTFTGRTRLQGANQHLPPVTHCEQIRASRQARNKALSRAMEDIDQWRAITVVGVHETGHCHVHTGIWADELVGAGRFEPVIQAHLNNCDLAEPDGHGAGATTIRSDSAGLTAELGKNVPGLDTRGDRTHGLPGEPEYRQFGATVLDFNGWKAVRF
jgi:hypothetical protein